MTRFSNNRFSNSKDRNEMSGRTGRSTTGDKNAALLGVFLASILLFLGAGPAIGQGTDQSTTTVTNSTAPATTTATTAAPEPPTTQPGPAPVLRTDGQTTAGGDATQPMSGNVEPRSVTGPGGTTGDAASTGNAVSRANSGASSSANAVSGGSGTAVNNTDAVAVGGSGGAGGVSAPAAGDGGTAANVVVNTGQGPTAATARGGSSVATGASNGLSLIHI